MDYLTLCREFVREFGIGGSTGPAAVTGQTGELNNVTRWIRDANTYIENLWHDWSFLWAEHRITLAAGDDQPDLPAFAVNRWHRETFCFDRDTTDRLNLTFVPWQEFTRQTANPSSAHRITERPDGVLVLDAATAAAVEFYGEYQKAPVLLIENGDIPNMPAAFHRIILARAAIMYANREDAPELVSGCESEYIDLLEKLESACLPGLRLDRQSANFAYEAEIGAIPGFG